MIRDVVTVRDLGDVVDLINRNTIATNADFKRVDRRISYTNKALLCCLIVTAYNMFKTKILEKELNEVRSRASKLGAELWAIKTGKLKIHQLKEEDDLK